MILQQPTARRSRRSASVRRLIWMRRRSSSASLSAGERIALGEKRLHLLYPDKGAGCRLMPTARELLQYGATTFDDLRVPVAGRGRGKELWRHPLR